MGYAPIPDEEMYIVAVQFPMKSLKGSKRDLWLRDIVEKYLNDSLGWEGLGHVDGWDMGQLSCKEKKYALTVFCYVVDAVLGVKNVLSTLRYSRLDPYRVKIAIKSIKGDSKYVLKYAADKKDMEFYL